MTITEPSNNTDNAAISKPPAWYKRLTPAYLAKFGVVMTVVVGTAVYCGARYNLGIDSQWFRCMEEKYFIIDKWATPSAAEVDQLDVIRFAANEDQAFEELDWYVGIPLAKVVIANKPGTKISVTTDGVFFEEPDGRSWKYGRGLESATRLNQPESAFVRELVLQEGELWMMGTMTYSVDSRYYGPVHEDQITGEAVFLW